MGKHTTQSKRRQLIESEKARELEATNEELREALSGEGALSDVRLPDGGQAHDEELHGRARIPEGGPPSHSCLALWGPALGPLWRSATRPAALP
jgi:hypothetical protein